MLARPADEAEAAEEEAQPKLLVESALQKYRRPGLLGGWPCTPLPREGLLSTLLEVGRAFRSTVSASALLSAASYRSLSSMPSPASPAPRELTVSDRSLFSSQ